MELAAIAHEYDEGGVNVAALVADGRAPGAYIYCVRYAGNPGYDITRHFYGLLTARGRDIELVTEHDIHDTLNALEGSEPWAVFEYVGGEWRQAALA